MSELKVVPNTYGGFRSVFYVEHKRYPTEQEIFDAGMRAGRALQWPNYTDLNRLQPDGWRVATNNGHWVASTDREVVAKERKDYEYYTQDQNHQEPEPMYSRSQLESLRSK